MNNQVLSRIKRSLTARYPEAFPLSPRFESSFAAWSKFFERWCTSPKAGPSLQLQEFGLSAEQCAWQIVLRERWVDQGTWSTKDSSAIRGYAVSLGMRIFGDRLLNEQIARSPIKTLLTLNDHQLEQLDPHSLLDLRPGKSVQGNSVEIERLSDDKKYALRERGLVELSTGSILKLKRREQPYYHYRYALSSDDVIDKYSPDQKIQLRLDRFPSLELSKVRAAWIRESKPFMQFLSRCEERLAAEKPLGLDPFEINYQYGDEPYQRKSPGSEKFVAYVHLFSGQHLIRLNLPMVGDIVRQSFIIPRDVLFATMRNDKTLHVECRGHRSFDIAVKDWKRAKELQDYIERQRSPVQRENHNHRR